MPRIYAIENDNRLYFLRHFCKLNIVLSTLCTNAKKLRAVSPKLLLIPLNFYPTEHYTSNLLSMDNCHFIFSLATTVKKP